MSLTYFAALLLLVLVEQHLLPELAVDRRMAALARGWSRVRRLLVERAIAVLCYGSVLVPLEGMHARLACLLAMLAVGPPIANAFAGALCGRVGRGRESDAGPKAQPGS